MRLVHYSSKPTLDPVLTPVAAQYADDDHHRGFKPRGLWLSDDDCEPNWKSWCEAEEFCLDRLAHAFQIELSDNHNVLILGSADELSDFHKKFRTPLIPNAPPLPSGCHRSMGIKWWEVAKLWQGIVISPYQWSLRLDFEMIWYYGWDIAGGCIWDTSCIAEVKEATLKR